MVKICVHGEVYQLFRPLSNGKFYGYIYKQFRYFVSVLKSQDRYITKMKT
jgi:hypothetical protein